MENYVCKIKICEDVKQILDERRKNLSYTQYIETLLEDLE